MRINTLWEVWTYDVWGNKRDGWEVNDRSCSCRKYPIRLQVTRNNPGTEHEFLSAYPTDRQIRRALGLQGMRGKIDTSQGDDVNIYVEKDNGYPLGELRCVSHESLSPIRKGGIGR